jgi:hypothetical protein
MKFNLDKKIEELSSTSSPYYCGSACFLSLLFLVREILSSSEKSMKKEFSYLEELILSLYEEDNILFGLSRKEELTDKELDDIETFFSDYASLIDSLTQLVDVCISAKKERYVPLLNIKKNFIITLAFENIDVFSKRDDMKESFSRVSNDIFIASKRNIAHE